MLNVEDNTNKNSATDGIDRWGSWGGSTKRGKKGGKGIQANLEKRKRWEDVLQRTLLQVEYVGNHKDIFRVFSPQECLILSLILGQISA